MDHLRRKGLRRTVEDILPDGMSRDDVEVELEEIRERLTWKRRLSWIYLPVMAYLAWEIFSDRGVVMFAVWVVVMLGGLVALTRLQHEKMARLEARGAQVIEAGRIQKELEDGGLS